MAGAGPGSAIDATSLIRKNVSDPISAAGGNLSPNLTRCEVFSKRRENNARRGFSGGNGGMCGKCSLMHARRAIQQSRKRKDSVSKIKFLSMIIWKFFIERDLMNDYGMKDQEHFPHAAHAPPGGHLFLAFAN